MDKNLDIFRIKTNNVAPQKGRILIAEPFLPGSYFNRSIVFLVEHSKEGTVGFILNKPIDFQVADFQNEFPSFNGTLHIGGPVNIESVYYIHNIKEIPQSVAITENLFWGGNYEVLKDMINSGAINKDRVRFFLGYSGWDQSQLKEELQEDSWLVSDIPPELVLNSTENLWKKTIKQLGGKYSIWENYPENPSFN